MKKVLLVLALAASGLFFMGAGCEKEAVGEKFAVIETDKGTIKFKFFLEDAPGTCDNFIKLTEKGFYNGLTFHRYIEGFMIQGGDPSGNGSGSAGYNIKGELNKNKHLRGTVSMAHSGHPDSGSCQFFICFDPAPHLDGKHTTFGQVTEGMDVLFKLRAGDVMKKVYIETK